MLRVFLARHEPAELAMQYVHTNVGRLRSIRKEHHVLAFPFAIKTDDNL